MRSELNQIETIERFLLDKMPLEEKKQFEQAIVKDTQLQEAVELQKQVTQRIQINAFREEALQFHLQYELATTSKFGLKFFLNSLLWIVIAGGLAVVGYSLIPKKTEKPSTSLNKGNEELTTNALPTLLTYTPPPAKLEVSNASSQKTIVPKGKKSIAPPVKPDDETVCDFSFLQPKTHSHIIDASIGGTIVMVNSKSVINIPGNVLTDENGKLITGEVEIRYTEYRNAAETAFSQIPANYNNGYMNSAGMFEVRAYQNGKELGLQAQKSFSVDYVLAKKLDSLAFFALNNKTKNWEQLQYITYGSTKEKDAKANMANEGVNHDYSGYRTQLLVRITGLESDLSVNDIRVNFNKDAEPIIYKSQVLDSGYYALEISHYRGDISITSPGYKKIILHNVALKNNKAMVIEGKFARKYAVYNPHAWFAKGKSAASIICDDMEMVSISDGKTKKGKTKKENGLLVLNGEKVNAPRQTVVDLSQPNLVQGLVCKQFGVYTCNQIYRLQNRVVVNPSYVDENGNPIKNGKVLSLIDLNYNGAFSGTPEKFECSKNGRNVLLLFTADNQIYACSEESMKKVNLHNGSQQFAMVNITNQVQSSQDLKKYLGL